MSLSCAVNLMLMKLVFSSSSLVVHSNHTMKGMYLEGGGLAGRGTPGEGLAALPCLQPRYF